jgi:hypothetical protein
VQNNLDKLFQPEINELMFETSRTNLPMMAIAEKPGFVEFHLPQDNTWGDPASDWIRFLWIKPLRCIQPLQNGRPVRPRGRLERAARRFRRRNDMDPPGVIREKNGKRRLSSEIHASSLVYDKGSRSTR